MLLGDGTIIYIKKVGIGTSFKSVVIFTKRYFPFLVVLI